MRRGTAIEPIFPSKATTGYTGSLTTYSLSPTITADNTTVTNKECPALYIQANNVTIQNCKIVGAAAWGIYQAEGYSGLTIIDTEVTSEDWLDTDFQINRAVECRGGNVLIDRLKAHGTWRGLNALADNITLQRSFVGDFINPSGEHSSAVHSEGNSDNVKCLHNFLDCPPGNEVSGAFALYPEHGPNTNWQIIGNFVQDAGNYSIKVGYTPILDPEAEGYPGESPNSDFIVRDNWFSTIYEEYEGVGETTWPVSDWPEVAGTNVWSNNRWWDLRATGGGYTNKHGNLIAHD